MQIGFAVLVLGDQTSSSRCLWTNLEGYGLAQNVDEQPIECSELASGTISMYLYVGFVYEE